MNTLVSELYTEIRFNIKRESSGFGDSLILSRINWSIEALADLFNLDEMRELVMGTIKSYKTGTVTATATGSLIDSTAPFGVWNVGNIVHNGTTKERIIITANSDSSTNLAALTFTIGDTYTIYNNMIVLPTDFKMSQRLMIHDGTTQIEVDRKMRESFNQAISNPTLLGRPYMFTYDQIEDYFEVYKNPTQDYLYDLYYYKYPAKLTAGTDRLPFKRMDRIIMAFATVFCFYSLQEWDLGDKWTQITNGLMQQFLEKEKNKYSDIVFEAKGFLRGIHSRFLNTEPASDPTVKYWN